MYLKEKKLYLLKKTYFNIYFIKGMTSFQLHLMLKELYGGLNAESTTESDTDSTASITEDHSGVFKEKFIF